MYLKFYLLAVWEYIKDPNHFPEIISAIAASIIIISFFLKIPQRLYRMIMVNRKAKKLSKTFLEWIKTEYVNKQVSRNTTGKIQIFNNFMQEAVIIPPGDTYEMMILLEIHFDDLEKIYKKNWKFWIPDEEIRKRCFDILSQSGMLEIKEKYAAYIFNRKKHDKLFEKYNIQHSIDRIGNYGLVEDIVKNSL